MGFCNAKPIWIKDLNQSMNIMLGAKVVFDRSDDKQFRLKVTAYSFYRVYLNGKWLGYGPARGPHGWFRVDEWDIPPHFLKDENVLVLEAVGYNSNSLALADQPAFIQAELICGNDILAYTSNCNNDFKICLLDHKVQRVPRYSFQRHFIEYYRMDSGYMSWLENVVEQLDRKEIEELPEKKYLPRRVSYPEFNVFSPVSIISRGCQELVDQPVPKCVEEPVEFDPKHDYKCDIWTASMLNEISDKLKGFKPEEYQADPFKVASKLVTTGSEELQHPCDEDSDVELAGREFVIFGFEINKTGFISFDIDVKENAKLLVTFDELLRDGDIDFQRSPCVNNIVGYELSPGRYSLDTFEPYTFKYLKFSLIEGAVDILRTGIRTYCNDEVLKKRFKTKNESLKKVLNAACETFSQNAVDIFMDCPSRERAGWLCDSYFTAKAAFDLIGDTSIEKNFLENYALPEKFDYLPDGMVPMCYPSEHTYGIYIPNWALWLILELEEYLSRSDDISLINIFEPRIQGLIRFFEGYCNHDGLLENLESWVFLEWSTASNFVQDVNYPSNMLYSAALQSAGRLYEQQDWIRKGQEIALLINERSFDGSFFRDNAVRKNGELLPANNYSEACQYYAFFCEVASPQTHAELWEVLRRDFGPDRDCKEQHPNVYPANAFIGNLLRLDLLCRYELYEQLSSEIIGYYLHMAEKTGTLWESRTDYVSCNHGFASYVASLLLKTRTIELVH